MKVHVPASSLLQLDELFLSVVSICTLLATIPIRASSVWESLKVVAAPTRLAELERATPACRLLCLDCRRTFSAIGINVPVRSTGGFGWPG